MGTLEFCSCLNVNGALVFQVQYNKRFFYCCRFLSTIAKMMAMTPTIINIVFKVLSNIMFIVLMVFS